MSSSTPPEKLDHLIASDPRVRELCRGLESRLDGVHLVGGCVRDLLLGITPLEIDVAVEGDAIALAVEFAEASGAHIERHERFGTATVITGTGAFDFASTRAESYPVPGALPSVAPASLNVDLERRDFSVNAIAVSLEPQEFGKVTAVAGAFADLDDKVLRTLHDRSFIDDPTRIWRMCRYAERLGFGIADDTDKAAGQAVADGALATVSLARHGAELLRSCSASEPLAVIEACRDRGLLQWLGAIGFDPKRARVAEERYGGVVELANLRVASVFWRSSLSRSEIDEFGLPRGVAAVALEASAVRELPELLRGARHSEIESLLSGHSVELAALLSAEGPVEEIDVWLAELRGFVPALTGDDLLEAGADQGPGIAVGLNAARVLELDHGCRDRDELLAAALAAIQSGRGGAS